MSDAPAEPSQPTLNPLGMTSHEFVAAARGRILIGRLGGTPGAMLAYKQVMRDGATRIVARAGDVSSDVVAEAIIPPIVQTHREESPEGEVIKFVTRLTVAKPAQAKDTTDEPMTPVSLDEGVAKRMALPVLGNGPVLGKGQASEPVVGTGLGRDVSSRFEYLDIESVLIPMIGSKGIATYTLCVSSQVGCAMGCTFCETAQMGLIRSLTAAEIVSQWFNAQHVLKVQVKNIVFMGMGEPLDNLSNVIQAIAVLKDHNGAGVPISQITVSTVGRVDGLKRLSEKINEPGWHRLGLALSLNAPNDTVRSTIMPINRKWKMAELQEALLAWPRTSGNKVCVEYVLIPGVNDSRENAREIAEFLRPFGLLTKGRIGGTVVMAILNLIPYNPRRNSPWPAPTEERVDEFLGWLMEEGVFAKRRRTKGRAMMGACGQLGSEAIRKRQLVKPGEMA